MTDDHPRTRHLHVVVSSVCRRDLYAYDRRECLALEHHAAICEQQGRNQNFFSRIHVHMLEREHQPSSFDEPV